MAIGQVISIHVEDDATSQIFRGDEPRARAHSGAEPLPQHLPLRTGPPRSLRDRQTPNFRKHRTPQPRTQDVRPPPTLISTSFLFFSNSLTL